MESLICSNLSHNTPGVAPAFGDQTNRVARETHNTHVLLVSELCKERKKEGPAPAHITQVAGDVTFSSPAWRGRVCHRSDSGLESLPRPVSISTMTKAITSVIVVACSSAWHFRRVPVRRHVLNSWPISARSAETLPMALKTVQRLARQFRSRQAMMRKREMERSR